MKTSFWTKLLDLLSPRLCVACGQRLSPEESVLCPHCMFELPYTDHPDHPYDNYMTKLFWGHFPIEKAVAMFFYEPKSKASEIIYSMKYYGRPETAESMGRIFARQLQATSFFTDINGLVPLPLTRKRKRQRGYNQAEEIAVGIGKETGIPIYNKVLKRDSFSISQTRLNILQRRENVENAFRLTHGETIAHKHLLLIDDVVTTGSTVIACAQQLMKADDVKISVLSLGFTKP